MDKNAQYTEGKSRMLGIFHAQKTSFQLSIQKHILWSVFSFLLKQYEHETLQLN